MRHRAEGAGRNRRPDETLPPGPAATEVGSPTHTSGLLHEKQIPAPRLAQLIMIAAICGYGVVSVVYR